MIEVENLSKSYGQVTAVKNVSFDVQKGEIVGLLGLNGAGKTTTMNIITGYISSTEGRVRVCGYDILDDPKEVKKRVGYLPEHPPIYNDMTVNEYLNFICDLKKVDKKKRKNQIDDIMELVKITDVRKRLINNLSKGYKQRVGLSQALVGNPEVLILDEPTVGLDPKQILDIRNVIRMLGKDHTIMLSSHILHEVNQVCNRVAIINNGEIVAVDTLENLSGNHEKTTRFEVSIAGHEKDVKEKIKSIEGVISVDTTSQGVEGISTFTIEAEKENDIRKPLFFKMAETKNPIMELKQIKMDLEKIFIQLATQNQKNVH